MQEIHTPKQPSTSSPDYRKQLTEALPVISHVNQRLMHIDGLIDIGLFVAEEAGCMAADNPQRHKLELSFESLFAAMKSLNSSALSDLLDVENGFEPEGRV